MFLSPIEIFDILVMCAALGFIFRDIFRKPKAYSFDPLSQFRGRYKGFNWDDFYFAIAVTAPAVILHEFGHKFVAVAFGASASFNAAYFWLGLGMIMKLMNFPFIFFVPAYVSISGGLLPVQYGLVAFAGPAVNLIIWGVVSLLLRRKSFTKKLSRNMHIGLMLTKRINLLLFIFNMIPFPGFDGYHVFSSLFSLI